MNGANSQFGFTFVSEWIPILLTKSIDFLNRFYKPNIGVSEYEYKEHMSRLVKIRYETMTNKKIFLAGQDYENQKYLDKDTIILFEQFYSFMKNLLEGYPKELNYFGHMALESFDEFEKLAIDFSNLNISTQVIISELMYLDYSLYLEKFKSKNYQEDLVNQLQINDKCLENFMENLKNTNVLSKVIVFMPNSNGFEIIHDIILLNYVLASLEDGKEFKIIIMCRMFDTFFGSCSKWTYIENVEEALKRFDEYEKYLSWFLKSYNDESITFQVFNGSFESIYLQHNPAGVICRGAINHICLEEFREKTPKLCRNALSFHQTSICYGKPSEKFYSIDDDFTFDQGDVKLYS